MAFEFRLSIAQILVSLLTCAVLEFAITFRRHHVIMWPASALLTGNGVAFILRVPGTEHGDWWSMNGWWIFAGTAAVSLLSKHVIRFRGHHIFNPSNFGLVLCFVVLGSTRADPLAFWWGPMSPWMVLALALIVAGGLTILSRIGLLGIAVWFWLAFAAGMGVLAASGHVMTASWHLGAITGWTLWRVLVFSPEVLVFLFFMITDPKTTPQGRGARRAYAVAVALLAVLLIAPQTTEFWMKVMLLASLTIVCAARPVLGVVRATSFGAAISARVPSSRAAVGAVAVVAAAAFAGILVVAGLPARPTVMAMPAVDPSAHLPAVTVSSSKGVASRIDPATARQIARDVVADLKIEGVALRSRNATRAGASSGGARLADLYQRIRVPAGGAVAVPSYTVDRMRLSVEFGERQGPPLVLADIAGTMRFATYAGTPPSVAQRTDPSHFEQTLELELDVTHGRYLIVGSRGAALPGLAAAGVVSSTQAPVTATSFGGVRLQDVAAEVGIDFRQGAFRFQTDATDPAAMMGGGVCWLDYDHDGWMDLFAVNSYSELDRAAWERRGGLPRSSLFHNVHGRFTDVGKASGADVALRGTGCVAADFNGDGRTDLYVRRPRAVLCSGTTDRAGSAKGPPRQACPVPVACGSGCQRCQRRRSARPVHRRLRQSGIPAPERHRRLSEHGHGRPRPPLPERRAGPRGPHPLPRGRATGRSRGGDGRLRARRGVHGCERRRSSRPLRREDTNPNRLYVNEPVAGGTKADATGLGFRFVDRARKLGVADSGAGMGIAIADYSLDGRSDVIVTNSHRQLHAAYRSTGAANQETGFRDARLDFVSAFDTSLAGWGVSWVDLDNDGNLDLAIANGAIPVTAPKRNVERIQVLENLANAGRPGQFADAGTLVGLGSIRRIGRVSRPRTTTTTAGSTLPSTRSAAGSSCSITRVRMGIGSRSRRARLPPAR